MPANESVDPISSETITRVPSTDDAEQALLPKERQRTPLPKKQLTIICLCRIAEPIASVIVDLVFLDRTELDCCRFTQIFPYINQARNSHL